MGNDTEGKRVFWGGKQDHSYKKEKKKESEGEGYQKWEGGNPKMEGKTQKWEGENPKMGGGKTKNWRGERYQNGGKG